MTKAVLERVDTQIKRRRTEVTKLHAELEDLEDYLDVLEARRRAVGNLPGHSIAGLLVRMCSLWPRRAPE